MQYKDLIYKITTDTTNVKKTEIDINPAKKSVQLKDVLIGIMIDKNTVLNKGISEALKKEIERTLTVLFNSPIADTFALLPYDKMSLTSILDLFPEKNIHYLATNEELNDIKDLKKTKVNLKMIFNTTNQNTDFLDKIDYLVTVNIDTLEPNMEQGLKNKNVMVFPMTFKGTSNSSQPEKLVAPDPTGWVYNSANGLWVKNWGWDGSATIPSWSAPSDWNLDSNPKN